MPWYQLFRRPQIVQSLEAVQDLIAVSLCMGLFCVMALQLKAIFASLLTTPQFHAITADILFILILVELFRLLIIYLQEQRVSIGVSVLPPLKVWILKRRFPLASASRSRPVPHRSDGRAAQYAQAILRCRFG